MEAELREEMEFHRSLSGDRAFGNATLAREDARAVWIAPWIESVWQDLSYAVRVLWREPGFALLAIGALTAGIGLNSSLFTVHTALAMKPWTVRDPGRVVRLVNTSTFDLRKRAGGAPSGFAQAELDYFASHATTISGVVTTGRNVIVRGGDAHTPAQWVGGADFSVLGVDMAAGRGFTGDEDRLDTPAAVAVLSHGYWQRQFGGDPAVVGRQIRLDDVPFTVVGVSGAAFLGTTPERVDIRLPVASAPLLRPEDRWCASSRNSRPLRAPAARAVGDRRDARAGRAELTLSPDSSAACVPAIRGIELRGRSVRRCESGRKRGVRAAVRRVDAGADLARERGQPPARPFRRPAP